ncbi:pyridoxamine 5'-phosphate oxidase family protein [Haladaptatus sp. DJG-WS-42]|uniref:pyridoxamine 5'-phosphate oxidase family protein n=1 Tax=Haladaptatus sp. DJG-WS-42 TaxID=3120516 RepID=UPI0030D32868
MSDAVPDVGQGREMNRAEIVEFLYEQGVGTLSLAADRRAYAVPVSFTFDGTDRLFFELIQFGDASKKLDFADGTEEACFVTFAIESPQRWRSVVATGPLDHVEDGEYGDMDALMDDNAWYPNLFPGSDVVTTIRRAVLRIADVTGRKGPDAA